MRYIRQADGRIRALEAFTLHDGREIARNTLGGTVASTRNLVQSGNCWVLPGASIQGNAYVSGNAIIEAGTHPCFVSENARVYGNATIRGATVRGEARVSDEVIIQNGSDVTGRARIQGRSFLTKGASVSGTARIQGEAIIDGGTVRNEAIIMGRPLIRGLVEDQGRVSDCVYVDETSIVRCDARASGNIRLINTILGCGAVVNGRYGDTELVDEEITDASLATNCPDRVPTGRDCEPWDVTRP